MNHMRSSLLAAAILAPMISSPILAADKDLKLVATKTSAALSIDGTLETVWQQAAPLTVEINEQPYEPNNGYDGFKRSEVEIRALYDNEYLYMVMRWEDPTYSLERFPWQKQPDGSWKVLKNLDSTGHENTYYEDKFAFFWNINQKGFAKKGCDKSCHMPEKGLLEGIRDTSAGRHYTNDGEFVDIWHWKSARTNPVMQVDDQFLNSDHNENKGWGRHSDEKTGGGYKKNENTDKTAPSYMNQSTQNPYWVLDSDKTPFKDTFKAGDVIGGMILQASEGSRGDITGRGEWQNGVWTLELKRKLVTSWSQSSTQDVQFDDLKKAYYFGVTAFDNTQIAHVYHKGSIKLTFAKP